MPKLTTEQRSVLDAVQEHLENHGNLALAARVTVVFNLDVAEEPELTFKQAADRWYELAGEYDDFGASDTEPRGEFSDIVVALCRGDEPSIPRTARDWQLFSDMDGSSNVARELTAAAEACVQAHKTDPGGAREYAKYHGWYW